MLRHQRNMLNRLDYQVMTAEAVEHGLRIARDWSPDAVVVDFLMPERDGLNFIMAPHLREQMRVVTLTGGGRLGRRTDSEDGVRPRRSRHPDQTDHKDALNAALAGAEQDLQPTLSGPGMRTF